MARRRLLKMDIKFVSLVGKGANKFPVLYKSDDDSVELAALTKFDEERGELLAVVYAPEVRDAHGDIASAEVIKDAAYGHARSGSRLDVFHNGQALESNQAFVAEHFIVAKGDERFQDWRDVDGNAVDVTGGWAQVIKILDPGLRQAVKDGQIGGVSMGGVGEALVEKDDDAEFVARFARMLKEHTDPQAQGADEVNEEQLKAALAEFGESLTEKIAKALAEAKPAPKAEEPKAEEPKAEEPKAEEPKAEEPKAEESIVKFEGDPTNPEDVQKHRDALRKAELERKLSEAKTADEVEEILKALKPTEKPAGEPEESAEVKELRAKLAKALGKSNQPSDADPEDEPKLVGISKEDQDLLQKGRRIGQAFEKMTRTVA